jgi:RimJ/RimL family protein N-acetyltransferase
LIPELRTERLLLRAWRPEDREPFAAMNADPAVMQHYLSTRSREESDARVGEIEQEFAERGFGKWAVEIPGEARFAGLIGLCGVHFKASFTPCVEIGWRLARAFWGRGYATEGARAALAFGFERLRMEEIVSFTVPGNLRSIRVMEKIGMRYSEEFEHPLIAPGHPLRRHLLYRSKPQMNTDQHE